MLDNLVRDEHVHRLRLAGMGGEYIFAGFQLRGAAAADHSDAKQQRAVDHASLGQILRDCVEAAPRFHDQSLFGRRRARLHEIAILPPSRSGNRGRRQSEDDDQGEEDPHGGLAVFGVSSIPAR